MLNKVYAFPDAADLSRGLDDFMTQASQRAIEHHGVFSVAISGGSLPKLLAGRLVHNTTIDFSRWHLFWADERCVPLDNEQSNYLEVKKTLLDHLPIPQDQIYTINPTLVNKPRAAAKDYQLKLKAFFQRYPIMKEDEWPSFDVVLLGMGPDGHCCSLFPEHPLLEEKTLWVASITDSPKPPLERITLTLPVLTHATSVVFVTVGKSKQEMVHKILEQPEHNFPCQLVVPEKDGLVFWFIDVLAAGGLSEARTSKF
ncbi:6-phosphogluconolactonase [Spinellus fusiger]|nr:6-phosphogluconolactonase [Spinellus fusiger]